MRELADKAATERALARCRAAGMPGFGPGGRSFFPRTWLLPEARDEFAEHVRVKRAAAIISARDQAQGAEHQG